MDTSKLVVGRKVWMQSGNEYVEGLVIEITEKYVTIKVPYAEENPWDYRVYPRFDRTGKQPEGNDPDFDIEGRTIDAFLVPRPFCGKSGKPWELVDKPEEDEPTM